MACSKCHKKQGEPEPAIHPMNATDLLVVDHQVVRPMLTTDWPADKHKLVIFYPETFTPVCQSELGAINQWLPAFGELDCVVIAACTDQAEAIKSWYEQESMLNDLDCMTFSSYLLPARLGLVDAGRAKRSSVFITKDGQVVKQEHFHKVGRSLAELHRMLFGYTTDSYCAENWQSPADGFLQPQNDGDV